jgi:hypothetical protein
MQPLSRQLTLPFRAPPAAAPRVLTRPAVAGRTFAAPQRAAQELPARLARAMPSMEATA